MALMTDRGTPDGSANPRARDVFGIIEWLTGDGLPRPR
jgi:hypothetical protein